VIDDDRPAGRRDLLVRLLAEPTEAAEIERALAAHGWDAEEALVVLGVDELRRVLDAVADGSLRPDQARSWAEAIEGRDDVGRPPATRAAVNDLLHILANPELEGPLDRERAGVLAARLPGARGPSDERDG
jgi:hypothetical protein